MGNKDLGLAMVSWNFKGNGESEKVIGNFFGFHDVTDLKMISENGKYIGAVVWHWVAKVVGYIGRERKPMFKNYIRKETIYFNVA